MKGIYEIQLYNNRVHYHLTIRRNITILQGSSATGKSELLRLLATYNARKESSGITLLCERTCTVLTDEDWEERLSGYHDRILFADEGNHFLKSKRFAELVRNSDNYFVLICRDSLYALPYSIEEIYAFREAGQKYNEPRKVYNEMERIYSSLPVLPKGTELDEVVVEDSNSGFDFFRQMYPGKCHSANGKSNVERTMQAHDGKGKTVLAIVDGAAFGPEMSACMRTVRWSEGTMVLYAPESFECLLLQSEILPSIPRSVWEETWAYADSKEYFSWEEFYTHYLSEQTRNTVYQYSKHRLGENWLTSGNVRKVLAVLPEAIRGEMSES